MKEETAVAFIKEARQDVKSGSKRCVAALVRVWNGFWAEVDQRRKDREQAEAVRPEAVRVAELQERRIFLERTQHPLGGTVQFVALLGFLAFLIGLLFLPMEIAGSFEGDLTLDTGGSGLSIVVPQELKSWDFNYDRDDDLGIRVFAVNTTNNVPYTVNKSLSININGGQGTLKGTYSVKAPSIIAIAYLVEMDRITAALERLRQ